MENEQSDASRLSRQIIEQWLIDCTRHGKISRNTIAVGIVVLDHLRRACPVERSNVVSPGGEISGARSRLPRTLETYGIPHGYLKEVTTRQGHQDGQRLLNSLSWGRMFTHMNNAQRDALLLSLIGLLKKEADKWLKRQNIRLDLDRRQAPTTWIRDIVEAAEGRSGGVVEQQLVGAKLSRRFPSVSIPNHPAHAGDAQTERAGDFDLANTVFHVTAAPGRPVLQKCAANARAGLHPVLLVPQKHEERARILAQDEGIDEDLTLMSIESFLAANILELAVEGGKDLYLVLQEILGIYNQRLRDAETDLSLLIDVR